MTNARSCTLAGVAVRSLAAACLAIALLPGCAKAATQPQLRWAPPQLTNPITIQLGQGYSQLELNDSRDYIIKMPPYQKVGGTKLIGGHNIVIEGGSVEIPPDQPTDAHSRGFVIQYATGTVHIEGVLITAAPGANGDGIGINAPLATVQLENIRIVGLSGGYNGYHADLVQPWGGVKDLRIDGLSGSSNYQGLFIDQDKGPIGSATLQRVNMWQTPGPYDGGGHMLWITRDPNPCTGYPISMSDVFIQPRAGRTLANSVWPMGASGDQCHNVVTADGGVTWPSLPVSGEVAIGTPPGGDFVPAGVAGLDYTSPGYCDPSGAGDGSGTGSTAGTSTGGGGTLSVGLPDPAPPAPAVAPAAAPDADVPAPTSKRHTRRRPRLALRARVLHRRGRLAHLRIRGRVRMPGIGHTASACTGPRLTFALTVRSHGKTIARRRLRLRSSCSFTRTIAVRRRALRGARRVSVTLRFRGGRGLRPASARGRVA